MFSGIIEKQAQILSVENGRFIVENHFWTDLQIGQSIAHDGACMTLESFTESQYTFFVMEESLSKTNFWEKKSGDTFNIERSMKVWDRIDGHFVTGHVDTTGTIKVHEKKEDDSLVLGVQFEKHFSKYTIPKGSIAINGVSLTIIETQPWYLSISLIPLTQDWTNLWNIQLWETVNLEFDMLGKYILNK